MEYPENSPLLKCNGPLTKQRFKVSCYQGSNRKDGFKPEKPGLYTLNGDPILISPSAPKPT